jgi:hypothetical protein
MRAPFSPALSHRGVGGSGVGSGVVLDIWRFVIGCAKFMRHLCKVLIPNGTGPRSRACHLVI